MALGRFNSLPCRQEKSMEADLEIASNTRIIGRKRIVVSNCLETSHTGSPFSTPMQKRRSRRINPEGPNRLESLPQDILVRILCKVNHSDLRQLLLVSKPVNEATLIAREQYFAFSTPSSKSVFNRDLEDSEEAPNAPKQCRVAKSRMDGKNLASIAIALFATSEEQPKKGWACEI